MAGTVRDNALIGQVVANYRVGPLLGRGGMGAVYAVTPISTWDAGPR